MNYCNNWRHGFIFLVVIFLCFTGVVGAQENSAETEMDQANNVSVSVPEEFAGSDEARANNPLANFTAVNVHNYYIGKLTGRDGKDGNQAWLRFAKPYSWEETNWIMRASLPLNTYPVGSTLVHKTGLGDLNT